MAPIWHSLRSGWFFEPLRALELGSAKLWLLYEGSVTDLASEISFLATRNLVKNIEKMWGKHYLEGLFPKFLHLSCIFIHSWLEKVVKWFLNPSNTVGPEVKTASLPNFLSDLLKIYEMLGNEGSLRKIMEAKVCGRDKICVLVGNVLEDVRSKLEVYLDEVREEMIANVYLLSEQIIESNVLKIPSYYRMMHRDTPKTHLPYVDTILTPLQTLLRENVVEKSETLQKLVIHSAESKGLLREKRDTGNNHSS